MIMNRRDFLKGMLAIAGGVALSQVPDTVLDYVSITDRVVDKATFTKPFGRLGSIKLNDRWYSLEDASLSMRRVHAPLIHMPNPDMIGRYDKVGGGELVNSSWGAEFFVSEDLVMMLDQESPEVTFEVESSRHFFSGKGFIENIQIQNTMVDEGIPLYGVSLEGIGKINRL